MARITARRMRGAIGTSHENVTVVTARGRRAGDSVCPCKTKWVHLVGWLPAAEHSRQCSWGDSQTRRLRQQMGGAGVLCSGQLCLWFVGGACNCKSGGPSKPPSKIGASRVNPSGLRASKPPFEGTQGKPHSKSGTRGPASVRAGKAKRGLIWPLFVTEMNGSLENGLRTGRQFSIVCVGVRGRS